jgi:hypothetical protein
LYAATYMNIYTIHQTCTLKKSFELVGAILAVEQDMNSLQSWLRKLVPDDARQVLKQPLDHLLKILNDVLSLSPLLD